jgi:DNA-binding MarR family transcriptional regulator
MSISDERGQFRVDLGSDDLDARLGSTLAFMRHVWALDHALQSVSKRMRAEGGLTGPQRLVVRVLGRTSGISAGALAQILHLHPSTVTGILQRLEGMGFVSRVKDPQDQRRVLLRLTAKGRTHDAPSPHTIEASVERLLRRMSQSQIDTAVHVLHGLVRELGAATTRALRRTKTGRR